MKEIQEFLLVVLLTVIGLMIGKQAAVLLEREGVQIVGGTGVI